MRFVDCIDIVGRKPDKYIGVKKYISTGAVGNNNEIIPTEIELYTYEDRPSRANLIAKVGNILFAKMADTKKVLMVDEANSNYLFSTGFFSIAPKKGILTSECLYYLLNSNMFQRQKDKYSSGATQKAITNKGLEKIIVNIPPKEKQETISKELDLAISLINKYKLIITQLDNSIKARFVEMFGDPKSNPNSYPIRQLSEHIEFLTSGSRGWAQYCVDDGREWFITIKNVKDCRISIDNMQPINAPDNAEAKRTKVQEGDLLISITADLGRTGVVTKEIANHGAYINQHLTCIRLNKEVLNPLYVAFFMESPAGKKQFESKNQSAVKAGLNFNSINSLRLLVPPMDEQNAFVGFVHQVDKSKVN